VILPQKYNNYSKHTNLWLFFRYFKGDSENTTPIVRIKIHEKEFFIMKLLQMRLYLVTIKETETVSISLIVFIDYTIFAGMSFSRILM